MVVVYFGSTMDVPSLETEKGMGETVLHHSLLFQYQISGVASVCPEHVLMMHVGIRTGTSRFRAGG